MKKLIAILLVVSALFGMTQPASAAVVMPLEPQYDNVSQANVLLSISANGTASVQISCTGKSCLTKTSVTIYIQKKVNNVWTRVNIGTTNNSWIYSTTNRIFIKNYSATLSGSGEYRAVAVFTFSGSTTETVTYTSSASY